MNGIATTLTNWNAGKTRGAAPPRATFTTLGQPGDRAQQRRVLEATLTLLAQDAPLAPLYLDESYE